MKRLFSQGIGILAVPLTVIALNVAGPNGGSAPAEDNSGSANLASGPLCTGYATASPAFQRTTLGFDTAVTVNWYCEGDVHVVVEMNWGDGSTSSYTCVVKCATGEVIMHKHDSTSGIYSQRGTYSVTATMSGFASGQANKAVVQVA